VGVRAWHVAVLRLRRPDASHIVDRPLPESLVVIVEIETMPVRQPARVGSHVAVIQTSPAGAPDNVDFFIGHAAQLLLMVIGILVRMPLSARRCMPNSVQGMEAIEQELR